MIEPNARARARIMSVIQGTFLAPMYSLRGIRIGKRPLILWEYFPQETKYLAVRIISAGDVQDHIP